MARPKKIAPAESAPLVKTVIAGTQGNPFQEAEKANEMPTLKSVGFARAFPGSREYVSYVITTRGREVITVEVSEPNMKAIASDEAKINFVTLFDDQDQTVDEDLKHIESERKAKEPPSETL